MVSAGRFDALVRIERPTRVRNAYGEEEITGFDLIAEAWAQVILPTDQGRSSEIAAGGRDATQRTVTFRLRYPQEVKAEDRIVWMGEPYGVEGYLIEPRRGEMTVTARFLGGTDGR